MEIYNYQKSTFKVDGFKGTFEGIHIPAYHWNGWHLPLFDYETAKKITSLQADKIEVLNEYGTYFEVSDLPLGVIEYSSEGVEFTKPIEFEGEKYFHIGQGVLCWELAKII